MFLFFVTEGPDCDLPVALDRPPDPSAGAIQQSAPGSATTEDHSGPETGHSSGCCATKDSPVHRSVLCV